MSQTTIPRSGQYRAIAGMIADIEHAKLVSAFNGEASAKILFGLGVANNQAERVAKLPDGSLPFFGIATWGANHQPDTGGFDLASGSSGGIYPKGGFEVMREGRIWVVVDAGLSSINPYSDRGYLRYSANGGNTVVGAWSNASDGGHNTDLTKVAQFVSGIVTSADGTTKLAMLELLAANKP